MALYGEGNFIAIARTLLTDYPKLYFPEPLLGWAEPLGAFRDEFLKRAREVVLAPTQSFSLRGLDAYWRQTRVASTAVFFQAEAWAKIAQTVRRLPDDTTASNVRRAMQDLCRYSLVAGPLWMETSAFNELLYLTTGELERLAGDTLQLALERTPTESLVSDQVALEHETTQARGIALSVSQFDRTGLIYSVLVESERSLELWPASSVRVVS